MSPATCRDPLTPLGQVVAEARLGGTEYREALRLRLQGFIAEHDGLSLDDPEDCAALVDELAMELEAP